MKLIEEWENRRLRLKPFLAASIVATAGPVHAITYPVKDAKTAISIARKACANKVSPTAKWHAVLDTSGNRGALWFVTTPDKAPRLRTARTSFPGHTDGRVQGHGSAVWIAVNEPHPYTCAVNVYYVYSSTPREKGNASPPAPGVVVPAPKSPALVRKRGA